MYTMPRSRDSIVNGRHLANKKQTKRGAREFALNDQWQRMANRKIEPSSQLNRSSLKSLSNQR